MSEPEVLYHYTTGTVLKRILKQGAILPDRCEPDNEKEVPTVTFSTNPEWEKTRYRVGRLPDGQLIMMGKELLKKFDGGLFRIIVPKDTAPMTWHDMREDACLSSGARQGIYDFAISVGARTSEWFSTFESVPEEIWINVEKLNDDGTWIELPGEEIPDVSGEIDESPVINIPMAQAVEGQPPQNVSE